MQDEQPPRAPIEQQFTRTHSNCHYQWLLEEKSNMMRLGFITQKQNQRLVFWVGKVSQAVRNGPAPRSEVDICLRPVGSPLPSLAIVSGWTEAYEKMLSDTRFWIRSGNGSIRKVFLLRWSMTPLHEVGCDLEVYEWDKYTKRERLSQHEIVLPENKDREELQIVTVLFSEIFGGKFPKTDPNSTYIFSLGRLRTIAKRAIKEDGYGLRMAASGRGAAGEVALAGANSSILQELSPFPPSSHLLGRVNQLQLQLPPATVGTGGLEQKVSGPEQVPNTLAANNSCLDPISVGTGPVEPSEARKLLAPTTLLALSIDNPKHDRDVSPRDDSGQGVPLLDRKHLDASQPPTSPGNAITGIPPKGEEKLNGAGPLHFPDPHLDAAPHIATSPTPGDPNKPIDTKSPECGSPFSDPPLEVPEPVGEVTNPPDDKEPPTSPLADKELPLRPGHLKEESPHTRDPVDQIDNPGDTTGDATEGETLERVLEEGTPSELPEGGPNPSVVHVLNFTDKNADIRPELCPPTGSDEVPVITGPAPKRTGGGVPAEAHPASGSVKQGNGTSSLCGLGGLGSSKNNTCSSGGNSATPAEVEGVEKTDPEPSGLGDPDSSTLIPRAENSDSTGNPSSSSGAHVAPEWPAVDACVTSPDELDAETISENEHQEELGVMKDILDKREPENIADSLGKIERSPHDSKPTGVGPVDSPGLRGGENGGNTGSEPLGRACALPSPSGDSHIPKAPEGTGITEEGDSVHSFEAAPGIIEKSSPPLKSSQGSDVSDSSYTSDISDISTAEVGNDTNTLEEPNPIIGPRVDSESLGEAGPSLDIDILDVLKDSGATGDVDLIDSPKSCSELSEKNIGSFESPPNPLQDSDTLEAATGIEPDQENDQVYSLNADSESLLGERLKPIQPTDSHALGAVDRSGSIEELDSASNRITDPGPLEGVDMPQVRSAGIGDPGVLGSAIEAIGPEARSKPSQEASSAPKSPQLSDVSKVVQAADSAQQINRADIVQAGPDSPEEIIPTKISLPDLMTPVVESVQDEVLVLVDGATDDIAGGCSLPGNTLSPGLLPSSTPENTSRDATLEGSSELKDIENPEVAVSEVAEDIFVDTTEEPRVPGAQRKEGPKGSDPESLPVAEVKKGDVSLSDPLGPTTSGGSISSSDCTGMSITVEGLENVPRTPSAVSITTPLGKGDSRRVFDTYSDTSENNPDSSEIPGVLDTEDRTTLLEALDTPHSCQVDLLKNPGIATACPSTSDKMDKKSGLSGIDGAGSREMDMGSTEYFTPATPPPTLQYDRHVPECSECRQAALLGLSGQISSEYASGRNSKSLGGEGSPRSEVDIQSSRRLSVSNVVSYVSSLWGKPASPKPPATPPQNSDTGVHAAADTVVTPQEAIKTPGSQRSRGQTERKVSWDDIVGGEKKGRSESSDSLVESSLDQIFLPPVRAGGNSTTSQGPYAGGPVGIGVQFGDDVYPWGPVGVHSVTKAEANPLARTNPASEHYEEPPSTGPKDEVGRLAVASDCRWTSDEAEDKEYLVDSPRPRAWAANRAIIASPIKSPFFNLFPWSDQGIRSFGPGSVRGGIPTPAIGPLGECSNPRSPAVGRTPRVGAESPCLPGQASCIHASSPTRSLGPNAIGSARCIHGWSIPADIPPVGDRLAPLPGLPGASERGMRRGRYQSVIQGGREEFAHSFMDESGRISPERFSELELLIKKFAQKHFSQLPPSLKMFESSASLGRSSFPPEFLCTSSLGERLRVAAVQNIICRHLVNSIFSATIPSFCFNMEAIAGELMKLDPLKQALWQVLTVEALTALPQYEIAAAKQRQRTVNEILVSIGAMSASPAATLAESLQNLVKAAQEAWEPTFKSKAQMIPEVDVENGAANFKMDPEDSLIRAPSRLLAESVTRPVLCLFPAIYQTVDGCNVLVAPGRALFSDFYDSAEMELQARLEAWNSGQRYARRTPPMRPGLVPHNTHPLTSPESESGRWSTRRMSDEHFVHNQWCSHPNDIEDETIDFWDVSRRLKEYDQEVLGHQRGRSTGSEPFSESRSSYVGRSESFSSSRWGPVYGKQEPVYERRAPVGGRRESFYGGRRESFRGTRDRCGW